VSAPATSATTSVAQTLADPDTPFAVVDVHRARRNIDRLQAKVDRLGVTLRPHVKTAKSPDVAALMHEGSQSLITVSTLAEAEAFADSGYTDITYAVGIDPHKIPRVLNLHRRGVTVRMLIDSTQQASAIAEASHRAGTALPTEIEIDCDGHRGGLEPGSPHLKEIGRILHDAGCLDGVLTHAGESYFAYSTDERRRAAENERDAAVAAATQLRAAGLPVSTVSVGSTRPPTPPRTSPA
jgi:D-serine deaminase-like pyridoxal phosphate-dependent protein